MSTTDLSRDRIVFRRTNTKKGRHISVTPDNSATAHLSYGRIILDADTPSVRFEAGGEEVGLVCFSGTAEVRVGTETVRMGKYDALYVPRDSTIEVHTGAAVDLVECRAPVANHYPLQFVSYETVKQDPGLHFRAGGPSSSRTLNMLIGKNVQAGRLMAGVTWSEPGNWTSWPPHEHGVLAEELYVFYDMPPEAFAIQMVYTDIFEPERVEVVHDGDVVIMPKGYHPNVSIPGHHVAFMWIMAAHRELEDRKFGVVNVHPDFAGASSGLDKGR